MGPAPALLDRRLLFFTGKGGVGKSTVTAATALLAAEQGQRVLVVEADDKGAIPGNFEQPSVGFEPPRGVPGCLRDGDAHGGLAEGVPQAQPARAGARTAG